jgi:3-oxo-5-alpha-steroid 4-dehydrogenase 1
VQEIPNLFALVVCIASGDSQALQSLPNLLLLAMFAIHYINRTIIFPCRIRGGKPSAFIPFAMAMSFCTVNGYIQCRTLTSLKVYPAEHIYSPTFIAGASLWVYGFYSNLEADGILRNLRKPGDKSYYIPRGGLFEYVSGANFFCEILEWTGFALAAGTPVAMCFAATTFLNIGPRAVQHHRYVCFCVLFCLAPAPPLPRPPLPLKFLFGFPFNDTCIVWVVRNGPAHHPPQVVLDQVQR